VTGGVDPPPPHPATATSRASGAIKMTGRSARRTRGEAASVHVAISSVSIINSANSVERSGAKFICAARPRAKFAAEGDEAAGGAGNDAAATRTAPAGRAVVVTVSVVPLMVQVPSGIEQLAVSVGGAANPLVLIGKVNALPAAPICMGCDGVTVGPAANVAVAVVFAVMVKAQAALVLPAHAPAQLVNVAPVLGTAVKVIDVPEAKLVPVGDC
jgi:hypothetical protein